MPFTFPPTTLLVIVVICFAQAQGQGLCNIGDGDMTGVPTTLAGYESNSTVSGTSYVLYVKGSTNCFGVIAEWRAVVNGGCSSPSLGLTFDVWREETPASTYQLVGRNTFNATNCVELGDVGNGGTRISLRIPKRSQIPIEDGNAIGWTYYNGRPLYVTPNNSPAGDILYGQCSNNTGGICTFIGTEQKDFLLEARLVRGPAPSIDNLDNSVDVYEQEPNPGTSIFTVFASHPSNHAEEGGVPIVDPSAAVRLTFNYDTSQPFNYTMDTNWPGALFVRTTMAYDFESQTQYLLPVSVTGLHQTASGTLTVNILDRNEFHSIDNLDANASASVLDTSCQTNPIYTVTCKDEDDPAKFSAKSFYIASINPSPPDGVDLPFTINKNTGEVFCTSSLQTWTTSMGTSMSLRIVVVDGMHSATGTLTVDIQETLDPPTITNLPATQAVFEDLIAGSEIFHVFGDGPSPSDIRFSITDVSPRKYYYYFVLDEISGVITLSSAAKLDYSIQRPSPSFTITVSVKDNVQEGTSRDLTVDLKWVNRKPVYDPDEYTVTIPEECGGATRCTGGTPYQWQIPGLTLSITDRDVDNPGPGVSDSLTCGILPSFGSSYFTYQRSPTPYSCSKLYQDKRIDIDDIPENRQINLTVWVKDATGVSNNDKGDTANIYITVTDINDNKPVFINLPPGNPPYTASIQENTPGGLSLFTVTATDKDSGSFGEITYTLEDVDTYDTPPPLIDTDATLHFEVDTKTGLVKTKQYLDYEAINPKYVYFNIRATDGGNQSSVVTASVTVTNVNDIRPMWQCDNREYEDEYVKGSPCFYNLEYRSDLLPGFMVLSISATDADSEQTQITYHQLQPTRYLSVDEMTGDVTVKDELSPYVKYLMYCSCQDSDKPSLWSQPPLRVRIDTFDPRRQLINIVMQLKDLNDTQQARLQKELRTLLHPWLPKIEVILWNVDRITASIYVMKDNSTYDENNIDKPKQFVDRNELLDILRKDLRGTPSDSLTSPPFQPFNIILVEPAYPIWFTDTIPGIITLSFICLAVAAVILGLILGLCSKYGKCCFEKNREIPERKWENSMDYDKLSNHSAGDFER